MNKVTRQGPYALITAPINWYDKTLEAILKDDLEIPKKMLHQWRMEKSVLLNENATSWSTKIQAGDTVFLPIYKDEDNSSIHPIFIPIEVLYEDDDLLVMNKPPYLNTHVDDPRKQESLTNAVAGYFKKRHLPIKPRHIHRLDKDTSGAILYAKNAYAAAILDKALSEGKIKRTYVALVEGIVSQDRGTIHAPIGKDRHVSGKMRISNTGKEAITHYSVLKRFARKNLTLVSCKLETGRTHQIRVHMSHIGHPLSGDPLYGGKINPKIKRQALHAFRLDFVQPLTKEKLFVECPIPFLDI